MSRDLNRWMRALGPSEVLEAVGALVDDAVVFAVDAERRVIYWSDAAERVLGFPRAEVLGQHCLKSNRCQTCMTGCGIEERGAVRDVPLVLHAADGRPVRLRKTARAFFDQRGAFAGGVELLRPDGGAQAAPVAPERPFGDEVTFHGMVSRSPQMHRAFQTLRQVAGTEGTVLIRGESGTGKELVAHAVHAESHRRGGPLVAINCAALSPALLESELFGHVRGAFTGAVRDRKGVFAQADGGTLFLDEVAELPHELQAKLLRVLQERTFTPVGGSRSVAVDVRLVAATHRSLRAEVAAGRFREDLMFRLRVIPIFLPPLRDRRGDVDLLLRLFIRRHNEAGRRRIQSVSPEAMRALLDHPWPGNVRELQNVVEYAFAVGRGPELALDELPPEFRGERHPGAPAPGRPRLRYEATEDERAAIEEALLATGGRGGDAADRLGMSRPTFWRKRKKYGL